MKRSPPHVCLPPPAFRLSTSVAGLLMVAATLLAYWPVWDAGFVWDDNLFLQCPDVVEDGRLAQIWISPSTSSYYPLTWTAFWVQWRVWGDNALGYHLVNLLLHITACLLAWRLLARLDVPGAWLAALLFAVHPVNADSVAWIAEHKNTLSLNFYLASFLAFINYDGTRYKRWYAAAFLFFLCALLSKASVAFLPAALLIFLWWRHRAFTRRVAVELAPFFLLAAAMTVVTVLYASHHDAEAALIRPEGTMSRLAASGWAVWFYMGKALFPLDLSPIYPRWYVDPTQITSWLPLIALVALLVVLWRLRERYGRAPLATLLYFIVALAPVLGLFDISYMAYSLVANHWQYLALLGLTAFIVGGCADALQRAAPSIRTAATVAAAGIVLLYSSLTWQHAGLYRDMETWCRGVIDRNPAAWNAHLNLGTCLVARGHHQDAMRHFRTAYNLAPKSVAANLNLGLLYQMLGDAEKSKLHFAQAAELDPMSAIAHERLAEAMVLTSDPSAAEKHVRLALQLTPREARLYDKLGLLYLMRHDYEGAVPWLQKAVALDATNDKYDAHLRFAQQATNRFVDVH